MVSLVWTISTVAGPSLVAVALDRGLESEGAHAGHRVRVARQTEARTVAPTIVAEAD
jgi:hypothetical protein